MFTFGHRLAAQYNNIIIIILYNTGRNISFICYIVLEQMFSFVMKNAEIDKLFTALTYQAITLFLLDNTSFMLCIPHIGHFTTKYGDSSKQN